MTHQRCARVLLGDGEQIADAMPPGAELTVAVGRSQIVRLGCERSCHPHSRFRVLPMFTDGTNIPEVFQENA